MFLQQVANSAHLAGIAASGANPSLENLTLPSAFAGVARGLSDELGLDTAAITKAFSEQFGKVLSRVEDGGNISTLVDVFNNQRSAFGSLSGDDDKVAKTLFLAYLKVSAEFISMFLPDENRQSFNQITSTITDTIDKVA